MLITIAVPIQFRGLGIAAVWTGEAVVLAILGSMLRNAWIKGAALAVMGLALADSVLLELDSGGAYLPDRLLVSAESAILVWQVAALFAMAWLFRTDPDETWRGTGTTMAAVGANALAVVWLSWEAYAYLRRTSPLAFEQPLQFTLSAIWAGYAVVLMTVGVSARMRRARQMSLALFAAVIAKMALIDLWTLRSAHRVIAFLGLGAVLLGCSVAYHRFREMIVGDGEGTATA